MNKERLLELIREATESTWTFSDLADYLLANGVIVPPCKVGDTVYRISSKTSISENKVYQLIFTEEGLYYVDDEYRESSDVVFGKTVFLTREEAEKKLKEGESE